MNWTISTYLVYLALTLPLTVWVAHALSVNGRVFLEDVFTDNPAMARAVNTLLVVGFYLLNLGFVLLWLQVGRPATDLGGLFLSASTKVGTVMLVVGLVHFANIHVFNSIRRRGREEKARAAQQAAWQATWKANA